VELDFIRHRPDRLWVADFTYVATWSGTVYVAFVFDVFSRWIVGWRATTRMSTELVLDTPSSTPCGHAAAKASPT
jgi:putative transposase